MQKINDSLYKITCGIVIFFFAYIFLGTTYNLSHMEPLSEHFTGYLTPVFLISGTILLLGLILWLTHLLKKLSSKNDQAFCCVFLSAPFSYSYLSFSGFVRLFSMIHSSR